MARTQQVSVEELVRQEEAQFIDQMGDLEAQRSAERNADQEIEDGIRRMRETVTEAYPDILRDELDRRLLETRLTLRRKAGLEVPEIRDEHLSRRYSFRSNWTIGVVVAFAILGLISLVIGSVIDHRGKSNESVATESQVHVSIEAIHVTGPNQVNIHVYSSTDADEVLLYRNTSVVNKWQKGGNYSVVEYHDRGTYVYFAEAFRDGVKTTSNQVQVVFGQQPAEKEVAR